MTRRGWKVLAILGGFFCGMAVVVPALGLLGTVLGLKQSFDAIGGPNVDPSTKSQVLADGISQSMNATAFGIAGAIAFGILGVPVLVLSLVMMSKSRE